MLRHRILSTLLLTAVCGVASCVPLRRSAELPGFAPFGSLDERVRVLAIDPGVTATLVAPAHLDTSRPIDLILYALPNGNSTVETMGRRMSEGVSWRFDIQNIAAQTRALRARGLTQAVVVYLEADTKSWPAWRSRMGYDRANARIVSIVDEIRGVLGNPAQVHTTLTGHSGGGSFMFGFIEGQDRLPDWLERIAFLDAVYNFEPKHGDKLAAWLRRDPKHTLVSVAYDDREIMLDGKKVVSDSGGTWRASQRMLTYFRPTIALTSDRLGEFLRYHNDQVEILLHPNPANRILHTEMIGEMNAYMHALLVRRADYERGASVLVTKRAYTDWTDGEVVLPPAAPLQGASAHTDHVDITWFSVTNMFLDFGPQRALIDGYVSRFPASEFVDGLNQTKRPLRPDTATVRRVMNALGGPRNTDLLLTGHSHYDHSFDTGTWSRFSGAPVIGSKTTCFQVQAQGLPADRCRTVNGGERILISPDVAMYVVRWNHSGDPAVNPVQHNPVELKTVPRADPVTGGLRLGLAEDFPNGGGNRGYLFVVNGTDGPITIFFTNSGSAVDLEVPIVIDGVDYGAPLANLKKAMHDAGLTSVDLWIGPSSTPVARLVLPVLKPRAFMPVHWDNFYTPFLDGVANPYSDTATVNYLASQGVKVIQPQQYMDKWRLDRSGVHVIDNSAAKRALGFSSARTLKDAYKGAFRIGAALSPAVVSGTDSITQRIVARQFNTITAENVMKQATINPEPGVFNFAPGDSFVAFGQRNGMFIVGHTLVWHNSTPAWFFLDKDGKPNAPAAQLERLREYIQATAGHYAGRVHAWDVVNEVVAEDGGYRPTTWVRAVGNGDTLVKYAFKYAQQSAPNTELYYNEFNAWRPAKRDGIMRLVRMLKKEGIRIDGVGMQGHWGLNYPETRYIEAAIDSFTSLGVRVNITELDVDVLPLTKEGQVIGQVMADPQFQLPEFRKYLDPYPGGLPDSVQQALARRYAELFEIFYGRRDKIDRVTFWGVHDGMSWKNGYPVPGRTNYPLLFDRNRQPKPAFDAVLAVPERMQ